MKLGSSFPVPADSARVFAHFLDPDSMRACIPGCAELERVDDTHYRGRLVNEIAHVRFSAGFTAEITELTEPEEVRAVLKGEDRKMGSSIKIDATLGVRQEGPGSSTVDYRLDVALWGKIGRLGESIVRRRTEEVERQFVTAFSAVCAGGPPGPDNPVLIEAAATGLTPGSPKPAASEAATPGKVSWWRRLLNLLTGRKKASAR
jgi:carbon monoxide dehydrogenase subunit G